MKFYPRGGKFLKTSFKLFGSADTVTWFESRGVKLKTEPDGRMFPVTDDSATIVNCLLALAGRVISPIQGMHGNWSLAVHKMACDHCF